MKTQTGYTITWTDSAERTHESTFFAAHGNPDRALAEFHLARQVQDKLGLEDYKVTDFKQDGFTSFLLPPKNPAWETLQLPKSMIKHYVGSKKKEAILARNGRIVSALMEGETMLKVAESEKIDASTVSHTAKRYGEYKWLTKDEVKLLSAIRAKKATHDAELDKFVKIAQKWISAA